MWLFRMHTFSSYFPWLYTMALWVIMLLNCPIFTSLCYPPQRKVCKHGGRATNLRFPSIIYSQFPLSELWVSCRQNTREREPQLPTSPVVTSHLNNNLTTHRAHSWELTTQACPESRPHCLSLSICRPNLFFRSQVFLSLSPSTLAASLSRLSCPLLFFSLFLASFSLLSVHLHLSDLPVHHISQMWF